MNNDDSPFASLRDAQGMPTSRVDRAIDRAVRKMMQVDPPAGLRRRVMSRIEAPPARRSIFVPAFAAAAAVAVLVLGIIAARQGRPVRSGVDAPATAVIETPRPADTRVAQAPSPEPAAAPRSRRAARERTGFRREPIPMAPVDEIFGERTSAITAAAAPTADAVWPVASAPDVENGTAAPRPIVVDPVGVAPIDTAPIVVPPIVVGRPSPPAPR
jgi:hypothetical protein